MDAVTQAALLQARSACAMIEALVMQAANQEALAKGWKPPHSQNDFKAIVKDYRIDEMSALAWMSQADTVRG